MTAFCRSYYRSTDGKEFCERKRHKGRHRIIIRDSATSMLIVTWERGGEYPTGYREQRRSKEKR